MLLVLCLLVGYIITKERAMKIVDKMPTEGQFIKVWKYNDMLWCDTLMWDGDTLFVYVDEESEGWVLEETRLNKCATDIHYIID